MDAAEEARSTDWMVLQVHEGAAVHQSWLWKSCLFGQVSQKQGPASGLCRKEGLEYHRWQGAAEGGGSGGASWLLSPALGSNACREPMGKTTTDFSTTTFLYANIYIPSTVALRADSQELPPRAAL